MRKLILSGVLAATGISSPALAWGDMGHMTVAAVAWEELDAKSRDYVTELLKLNPQYPDWVKGVSAADRPKIAFMRAATWPDVHVRKFGVEDGDYAEKPHANENVGYADPWKRAYWHYKNISYAVGNVPDIPDQKPNAVTRIKDFSAALSNTQLSKKIRSYDLTWLIHLVGDIHQPLHAVARVTPQLPEGDHGGNSLNACVRVCDPVYKKNDSLHSFWDSAIGTSKNPAVAIEYADKLIAAHLAVAQAKNDPDKWAAESYVIAKGYVYVEPIGLKPYTSYVVTEAYRKNAGIEANKRIYAAGVRLSDLIESNTPS